MYSQAAILDQITAFEIGKNLQCKLTLCRVYIIDWIIELWKNFHQSKYNSASQNYYSTYVAF